MRVLNLFHFVQNAIGVENVMNNLVLEYWNIESLISLVTRKGKEYIF